MIEYILIILLGTVGVVLCTIHGILDDDRLHRFYLFVGASICFFLIIIGFIMITMITDEQFDRYEEQILLKQKEFDQFKELPCEDQREYLLTNMTDKYSDYYVVNCIYSEISK